MVNASSAAGNGGPRAFVVHICDFQLRFLWPHGVRK